MSLSVSDGWVCEAGDCTPEKDKGCEEAGLESWGNTNLRGSAGLTREREMDGGGDGAGGQEAMPAEGQGHAVHVGAEELPGQSPLHAANLKEKMLVILTKDEERQHHRTAWKRLTTPLRQLLAQTELNQL